MRIAMFTDTYPPRVNGVATSVYLLRQNLEAMGHEVLIVTSADPQTAETEERIIRIPSIPFRTQRLATVAGPNVYAKIARFKPDIIHTHAEFTLGILGRFMAVVLKLPHVHTMHTVWEYYTRHVIDLDIIEPALEAAARKYTALICNKADIVVAPTRKIEDLLRSYKVLKDITIIPTGIDIDGFAPSTCRPEHLRRIRYDLSLNRSDKVLINVGRIEREKNLDMLLQMLAPYMIKNDDVRLVLVGDGTALKALQKLAAALKIAKYVRFAGEKPRSEINKYYRLGHIFVAASVSETQGLTYTEAMASGLPVVAKRDKCLENLLNEGENGFMFDDTDEFLTAIDKLLRDDELRARFSACAEATAAEFSSATYAKNVLYLYKQLVQ